MALEVDEDRAVGLPPPFRPVIHTQDPRRRWLGQRLGAQEAQERVGTDAHAELLGQAGASLPAEGTRQRAAEVPEPQAAATTRLDQPRKPLGEDALRAVTRLAEEAARFDPQTDGVALPRQIGHR